MKEDDIDETNSNNDVKILMKAEKKLSIRNLNGEEKEDEELFMRSNDEMEF